MSAHEHIELIPAKPEHAEELSRICHRAFDTLHERHRVHRDVPDESVGRLIIGGVLHRPDYVGVVAARDGRVIGSNFLQLADAVCGVGPITVEPGVQARGVGRRLMQWVIDEARRCRGEGARVRLFQEAVNTASLSLYTSLGFRWRETAALMQPPPADHDDPSVRPMTTDDLPEAERLSERHSGSSRVNDTARLLSLGLPAFVREHAGRVVGYQVSTLFGHASAESDDDLLTLASQTARRVPPPMAVVIVPMNRAPLFGAALASGFRVLKVLNGMSLGPCAPSPGPTFPSIQC